MSVTPMPSADSPEPDPKLVATTLREAAATIASAKARKAQIMPLTERMAETLAAWLVDHAEAVDDHVEGESDNGVVLAADGLCAGELKAFEFARALLGGD